MKNLILCLAALTVVACGTENNKGSENLITYTPMADLPEKEIILEDIADIEYIKLETIPEVFLSNKVYEVAISDNMIIVGGTKDNELVIFDRKGKYIRTINRTGKSAQEYTYLISFVADLDNNELYVNDFNKKSQVYDLEGNYKRTLHLDSLGITGKGKEMIMSYDKDRLLVTSADTDILNFDSKVQKVINPYYLIDKQSLDTTSIPVTVNKVIKPMVMDVQNDENGDASMISIMMASVNQLYKTGENLYISDFALDTIYNYNGKTLEPFAIRQYPSADHKLVSSVDLVTPKYVEFTSSELIKKDGKLPTKIALFERESGKGYDPKYILSDSDLDIIRLGGYKNCELPEKTAFLSFEAIDLVDKLDAGELSGKLKEVVETMTEEDNPLLVILKFK